MPKKSNAAVKWRENRYQLKEAKFSQKLPLVITTSDTLRFRRTPQDILIFCLLLNLILIPGTEAAAVASGKKDKISKKPLGASESPIVTTSIDATPTSSTSSIFQQIHAASEICNTSIQVERALIPVKCLGGLNVLYQKTPGLYLQVINSLNFIIKNMSKPQRCELETSARLLGKRYQIVLAEKIESPAHKVTSITGLYDGFGKLVLLPQKLDNPSSLFTVAHEGHHGYMSSVNTRDQIALNKEQIGSKTICRLEEFGQPRPATQIYIENGRKKLLDLLLVYDANYNPEGSILESGWKEKVSHRKIDEKIALKKLKKLERLTKTYQPHPIETLAPADFFIKPGLIDKNTFAMNDKFKYTVENVNVEIYPFYARKCTEASSLVQFFAHTVLETDKLYRVKAALLDGYYYLKQAENYHGNGDLCKEFLPELDTYLHQVYGSYPELFKFLFSDLFKYYESRMDDEHRLCLQR